MLFWLLSKLEELMCLSNLEQNNRKVTCINLIDEANSGNSKILRTIKILVTFFSKNICS